MRVSDQPGGDAARGTSPEVSSPASARRRCDPLLTASLYVSGAVDEAIVGWIIPFRARLRKLDKDPERFLWLWRHVRHGEHLKLRVHAASCDRAALLEAVEATARSFLADLQPVDPSTPLRSASWPPVDADEDTEPLPHDRSFRWTQYLRQAPILGTPRLQSDDEYTYHFCRCLGHAHDWLLDDLETSGWSLELAANLFTMFFATAIDVAGIAPAACLRTYRDWLIRLPLLKKKATQRHADAWTLKIQQRSAAWDAGGFAEFSRALEGQSRPVVGAWRGSLRSLFDVVQALAETSAVARDPFASSVLDLPLAKVLLALANSLGLSVFDQAVLVHRLLESLDPELAAESLRLEAPRAVDSSR